MQFLRNVWADLREKTLWPLAVALVVLLAAVPVFLGGGGGSAPATPAASAGAPPTAEAAVDTTPSPNGVVVVGDTTPQPRKRGGKLHNPFIQPKAPVAKPAQAAGGTPAPSQTPTTSSGTPGSGGTGSTTPSGTPAPAPKPPSTGADALDVYRVSLEFGQAGRQRPINDIPRLTPLPSKNRPFFVFLGVLKDGKTAVFLISSDVVATGDGKCRPSRRDCQTIELQAGDTQFFDLIAADGQSLQYEMDLTAIRKVGTTASVARAAYAFHSAAGQRVVRSASDQVETQQVRAYHYLPAAGVLVRARPATADTNAKTALAGVGAAPSSLPVFDFGPGEVDVFRSRPAPRPAR